MAYSLFYTSASKKDFKSLSRETVKIVIENHIQSLSINPFIGEKLSNPFKNCWKYSFSHKGTAYRIIYQIFKEELKIVIILVGSRENVYKKLIRRRV